MPFDSRFADPLFFDLQKCREFNMKILIYGLQSSGATAFAYLMSQKQNTIGVLDLYYNELSPNLTHASLDIVLKCTVSNLYSLDEHKKEFNPDVTILFNRNTDEIKHSLATKSHKNYGGDINEKISIFQNVIDNRSNYDICFSYEDMICGNIQKIKSLIDESAYGSPRSVEEIIDFNCKNSEWCKENFKKKWWIGCLHPRTGKIKIHKQISLL